LIEITDNQYYYIWSSFFSCYFERLETERCKTIWNYQTESFPTRIENCIEHWYFTFLSHEDITVKQKFNNCGAVLIFEFLLRIFLEDLAFYASFIHYNEVFTGNLVKLWI